MMMRIKAIVEKRVFGTMELEIPENLIVEDSPITNRRRINKQVLNALHTLENDSENESNITWDDDSTIHYAGNFVVADLNLENENEEERE